jgi:hypothetical protein
VILFSRIVSYAGLIVAWVGLWISTNMVAALVITVGSLLLIGGSVFVGLRRRRAADGLVRGEDAQRAYDHVRRGFLWNRLAVPVICVLILIYVDSTLGRALVVGGLLLSTFAAIPGEREILDKLRTQAEAPRGVPLRTRSGDSVT